MNLRLIATGGTFDKRYDPLTGTLVFRESAAPDMLRRARVTANVAFEQLPPLDSLDMGDVDRHRILTSCRHATEAQIVVLHGTDTMQDTATVLGNAGLKKTIVLTGAMVPYAFSDSDALFNLGYALAAAQCLPEGVYIAMNGQVFGWDKVAKNRDAGVFEAR
jgi:L-asparaginase